MVWSLETKSKRPWILNLSILYIRIISITNKIIGK